MNKENTLKIYEKYRDFLGPSPVYFECQDGWFNLIDELFGKLAPLAKALYIDESSYPSYPTQVKEKYASLRVYMNTATEEMYELIDEAEEKSKKTCEVCGEPGELYRGAWYETLCPKHGTHKIKNG